MKTIKTSELTGAALDWAVAKCEGEAYLPETIFDGIGMEHAATRYSTNWSQGGPIIEREQVAIDYDHDSWNAAKYGLSWYIGGPTALIAAMRCYVASKLGSEIEVPEELV